MKKIFTREKNLGKFFIRKEISRENVNYYPEHDANISWKLKNKSDGQITKPSSSDLYYFQLLQLITSQEISTTRTLAVSLRKK
jgi:hypothetical protein